MLSRRVVRYLSSLGFLGMVGFFAVGCTLDDSPTVTQLTSTRNAINAAEKDGAKERFPDEFADLEKRYLKARGIFYACNESEASSLASQVATDAAALAARPTAGAPEPPANMKPLAALSGPTSGVTNQLLAFSATDSTDKDGSITSYKWDFGDGTTSNFTFPRATHRYENPGTYLVQLIAEDDKGATAIASQQVVISEAEMMSLAAHVLFDHDSSELRPQGKAELDPLVQAMQSDPQLAATIVGHTDSDGTDDYNLGLSERRAQSVADYVVDGGISSDRLKVAGLGESDPVASNDTPEGRQENRRVNIEVTAMKVQ